MDPISGLKGELLRPLVTLLLPGVFAGAPIATLILTVYPQALGAINASGLIVGAIILFGGLFFGMILEDLGSRLEAHHWKQLKNDDPALDSEWGEYLCLKVKDEIVGQRYLDTIMPRLKFELSMVPATLVVTFGLLANIAAVWVFEKNQWTDFYFGYRFDQVTLGILAAVGFAVVLCLYFYIEAKNSVSLLATTRKQIIQACTAEPSEADRAEAAAGWAEASATTANAAAREAAAIAASLRGDGEESEDDG